MNTFHQANIFFMISSIGFVLLWILSAILLIYIIRLFRNLSRISTMLEKGVASIGDDAKALIEDLRESPLFGFVFGRRKKRSGKNTD